MRSGRPRAGWLPPADGSRDPRTEDRTNLWVVHLIGRMLLPLALKARIAANAVSVAGFLLGAGAAFAYLGWREPGMAMLGFLLCVGWLILDGLDGMIARASGTASALGRLLDGVCDHCVFLLLYLALGSSLGTTGAWLLALAAGAAHAVQATLYEGERVRYHRRIRGELCRGATPASAHRLARLYDAAATSLDRFAAPFERALAAAVDRERFAASYGQRAAPALKLMALLSNNMRVMLIFLACLAGDPRLFWWIELGPLSLVAAAGILWHRRIEARLAAPV